MKNKSRTFWIKNMEKTSGEYFLRDLFVDNFFWITFSIPMKPKWHLGKGLEVCKKKRNTEGFFMMN